MRRTGLLLILSISTAASCSRPDTRFSLDNARAHVQMLAGTIGSRPIGTPENQRARQYIVDQLRLYGYEVRVQEIDARRAELARTARVSNIIAEKPGSERGALGIVSHYDSAPESPGAADDGMGVAVALEAARLLAVRPKPRHALLILITDGEEAGLMGAAGLTTDRDVMNRLEAYINVEATGSKGAALLFESGPGNDWIVKPWARAAPHPRGDSYATEIYRRLPNDTDFSILKRQDVPGLNFAVFADSYPYHTARDTPERLTNDALLLTGENVVSTALALDAMDLRTRSASNATYFDVVATTALSWGPVTAWILAAASLVCGLLAWFKIVSATIRLVGTGRWIFEIVWTVVGVAFTAVALVVGTWLLRAARTVYHPWYARPQWMLLTLVALGALTAWAVTRAGMWMPERLHAPRDPIIVWSLTLPVWIVFAGVTGAFAPVAAYLWTIPLLIAGIGFLAIPLASAPLVRTVSVVVLAVAGTLWLRGTAEFLGFLVALLGRLPIITPVWLFAAVLIACAAMVVPPLIATVAATRRIGGAPIVTAALLAAIAVFMGFAYASPAYTFDRPQRRAARLIVEPDATTATYEVASQEPGLDLDTSAPGGWYRVTDAPKASVPLGAMQWPFVFRTTAPSPGQPPAKIGEFSLKGVAAGTELTMTIVPQAPGLSATFILPDGVTPARSSLPGLSVNRRWRATYVAIPDDGVTWHASFKPGVESKLPATQVLIRSSRFPGGDDWQSLPGWLPQQNAVWRMDLDWILKTPEVIAPVPPLRR